MSTPKTEITRDDILAPAVYAAERRERRQRVVAMKRNRRVAVGPYATFHFENYDTMFQQIHEMLHIEKGGEEQIADELRAYNPMIPKGTDLSCTLMFEIDDPKRREVVLSQLGHVEETISLRFGPYKIAARAEDDVERTNAEGKTSAVHFLHFDMTAEQIAAFKTPGTDVTLGFAHPDYGHIAILPEAVREALATDLFG